jgi:hypothetical protein
MLAPEVTPLISNVPASMIPLETAMAPAPVSARVEFALIVVEPVKVLIPLKVSLPDTTRLPAPPITPEKVSLAAVSVKVFEPNVTTPDPLSVSMLAAEVVPLMSKVPASATPLDVAMEPDPVSARVEPALIVVVPV